MTAMRPRSGAVGGHELEAGDAIEVTDVAREQGQAVRERDAGDERIGGRCPIRRTRGGETPFLMSDTDIFIDAIRGRVPQYRLLRALIDRDELAVASLTVFELELGAYGDRQRARIDEVLGGSVIFPLDARAAKMAGVPVLR